MRDFLVDLEKIPFFTVFLQTVGILLNIALGHSNARTLKTPMQYGYESSARYIQTAVKTNFIILQTEKANKKQNKDTANNLKANVFRFVFPDIDSK